MSFKMNIFAGYLVYHGNDVVHWSRDRPGAELFCNQRGIVHDGIEQVFVNRISDRMEKQKPWNGMHEPDANNLLVPVET
jgi:hypothetical protein